MTGLDIKDTLWVASLVVGVAGSHFMLRGRVAVLEERLRGHSEAVKRIFEVLERIENKLDNKADKPK